MASISRQPDTVHVEHSASEAKARMDAAGTDFLCVVDGDLLIGVLSREQLRTCLNEDPDVPLQDIMERTVFALDPTISPETGRAAMQANNAPYALLIDHKNQVLGLMESKPGFDASVRVDHLRLPGGFINLSADQQIGSTGNPGKAYSVRPRAEDESSER